jgi:hypothetical protein
MAFLHARETAEELGNEEIVVWLDNCKIMATDADINSDSSHLKK